jgi:transcription antitermination factor NusG
MALKWYVVHAYSQYEKKVAIAIQERIERLICRIALVRSLCPQKK